MKPGKLPVRVIQRVLHLVGYNLVRRDSRTYSDFGADERRIIEEVKAFTRTGPERLHALIQAVKYIANCSIPGAIVECGVWRGGSMMAVAKTLIGVESIDRDLYLYDTFEGMSDPTVADVDWAGTPASQRLAQESREAAGSVWCLAPLDEVGRAMQGTGYPPARTRLVKGMVEQTIPAVAPEKIALLRLDTDWYESTRHELNHLFPRLVSGGVLILDDYGHWQGARRAWDEYSAEHQVKMLLNRVDYSARIGIKL
jgi:hypothetical protein